MFDMLKAQHESELECIHWENEIKQAKEEGKNEGISEGTSQCIRAIMQTAKVSAQQAMDILMIPTSEQPKYAEMIR